MLNSLIKFDLHIHSFASSYKETNKSIVKESTKEHLDNLFNKLIENKISLFSITDHNRFDYDLYIEINKKLENFPSLHVLPGVEFDVQVEKDKKAIHIITIFNTKNDNDLSIINKTIENDKLQKIDDFYDIDRFFNLLKKISLDTIFIVHQKGPLNSSKANRSLSTGTNYPYVALKSWYVDALEYSTPTCEGAIKNNLLEHENKLSDLSLVTGSDCHEWKAYPYHDSNHTNEKEKIFSEIKSLPTFRGLLLSLTSPKTRFNRYIAKSEPPIKSFSIRNQTVEMDAGINVIIGENGSGKSSLMEILSNSISMENYVKKIKENNSIKTNYVDNVFYVRQAELIKKFDDNKIFDSSVSQIGNVDNSTFESEYNSFNNSLMEYIKYKIIDRNIKNTLKKEMFSMELDLEKATYYVSISKFSDMDIQNPITERKNNLESALKILVIEYKNKYYLKEYKNKLKTAIENIYEVYSNVRKDFINFELILKVKNIINNKINNYQREITTLSISRDKKIEKYNLKKQKFIDTIVSAIKNKIQSNVKPIPPSAIEGKKIYRNNGFIFSSKTKYDEKDVLSNYLKSVFVKNYADFDKIDNIDTLEKLCKAILNCTNIEKCYEIWLNNYEKFKKDMEKETNFIQEERSTKTIGGTLGEMSLAYYKYQTTGANSLDAFMVDQPEDNISNNRIANDLISYFDNMRSNGKQVLIATHNPLLVVNLDVDNVIYLKRTNEKIDIKSGCLEDENNNILDIVAETLDGGRETIEKRLKIYGKNN